MRVGWGGLVATGDAGWRSKRKRLAVIDLLMISLERVSSAYLLGTLLRTILQRLKLLLLNQSSPTTYRLQFSMALVLFVPIYVQWQTEDSGLYVLVLGYHR